MHLLRSGPVEIPCLSPEIPITWKLMVAQNYYSGAGPIITFITIIILFYAFILFQLCTRTKCHKVIQ